jgi:prepilin-type N-terminal cleavage/methylation domain-containing protein
LNNKRNLINNNHGFSLIEIMIAISMLALITLAIISIQSNSRNTKDRVVNEDRALLQVETAFERFDWDFSHIYSPMYFSHEARFNPMGSPEEKQFFEQQQLKNARNERFGLTSFDNLPVPTFTYPDKQTLIFFTLANRRKIRDEKTSNFAWVKYTLEKDDSADASANSQMWVRYFSTEDPFSEDAINWGKIRKQILLRNVTGLKMELWGENMKKWFSDAGAVDKSANLIRGIKLTLNWLDFNGIEETFTRVFTPLFPYFKPEDMYQYLNSNPTSPGLGGGFPGGGNNSNPTNPGNRNSPGGNAPRSNPFNFPSPRGGR